jgi:HAD superfamily hydrolase (TIGR01509 family)
MPRLYVFDMGGVVSENVHVGRAIADYLGLNHSDIYEMLHDEFHALMAGTMTEREFWQLASGRLGRPVEADLLERFFQPRQNREVVQLVLELKEEARVVVGTNTIEGHYRIHRSNGDYDAFDAVYASHRMGLTKPDPAFYRFILGEEGVTPGESVFVDDLAVNVEAARRLGMRAFLFAGARALRAELEPLRRPPGA